MKVITSTHYNRPTCTMDMLDHLAKCDGIENYKIICCVEPVNGVLPALIDGHPLNVELVVNDRLLGLWANKKKALTLGFNEGDYVIHVEDDILLAKDALTMFEACYDLKDDPSIFTVTSYRGGDAASEGNGKIVSDAVKLQLGKSRWYTPWGWATWKDRWDSFKDEWDGHDQVLNHGIRGDRFEVFPLLSRTKSIGYKRGEYTSERTDAEMFNAIKNARSYGCKNGQDILDVISEYKLKRPDGIELIKQSDNRVGTKRSERWGEDCLWAGDYEIPDGDFEHVNVVSGR